MVRVIKHWSNLTRGEAESLSLTSFKSNSEKKNQNDALGIIWGKFRGLCDTGDEKISLEDHSGPFGPWNP